MLEIYNQDFRELKVTSFEFSGGEVQVKITDFPSKHSVKKIIVKAFLYSSSDIMELILAVDILRRNYGPNLEIEALIPYLPYARQDRAMVLGESLALKAFANIINSLGFSKIAVWDVHSDVALGVIDNIENVPVENLVGNSVGKASDNVVLVSPDAGSLKKVSKVAQKFGREMIRADKTRSVADGSITGTVVYSDHLGDSDVLIVDDICDGGRTFIELAKHLRKLTKGKIKLYVTHGIFSKGLGVFEGFIDEIYCANIFPNVDRTNPILKDAHAI